MSFVLNIKKGKEEEFRKKIEGIKTVDDLRKFGMNEDEIYGFFEAWVEAIYGVKDNKTFVQMFFNCLNKEGEEAFCEDLRSYMLDDFEKNVKGGTEK